MLLKKLDYFSLAITAQFLIIFNKTKGFYEYLCNSKSFENYIQYLNKSYFKNQLLLVL